MYIFNSTQLVGCLDCRIFNSHFWVEITNLFLQCVCVCVCVCVYVCVCVCVCVSVSGIFVFYCASSHEDEMKSRMERMVSLIALLCL